MQPSTEAVAPGSRNSLALKTKNSHVQFGSLPSRDKGNLKLGISPQLVGCVICVSCVSDESLTQASRPLPPLVRGDFVSEVILIIRLPVRPSRLKAISMPTVLRNVWQRRNRPARARGFFGHPAVLSGTPSPA